MEKPNKISREDFQAIQNAKTAAAYAKTLAEKAESERKLADSEARNVILMAYLKYGMSSVDSIDGEGNITRVEVASVEEEEEDSK